MPTKERRAQTLGIPVEELPDGRGKHGHHVRGSRSHRWNDGLSRHEDGYIKVSVGKAHPLADPNGYAFLHLLVWRSAGNAMELESYTTSTRSRLTTASKT